MRKMYLILFFALIVITSVGQTRGDQTEILKKCLDLPELQSYLALDSEGKTQQITIVYYHPLLFPTDLIITKGEMNVIYKEMPTQSSLDPFILFKTFHINGDITNVFFEYHYGATNCSKLLQVNIDFKKIGTEWSVLKASLNNQE